MDMLFNFFNKTRAKFDYYAGRKKEDNEYSRVKKRKLQPKEEKIDANKESYIPPPVAQRKRKRLAKFQPPAATTNAIPEDNKLVRNTNSLPPILSPITFNNHPNNIQSPNTAPITTKRLFSNRRIIISKPKPPPPAPHSPALPQYISNESHNYHSLSPSPPTPLEKEQGEARTQEHTMKLLWEKRVRKFKFPRMKPTEPANPHITFQLVDASSNVIGEYPIFKTSERFDGNVTIFEDRFSEEGARDNDVQTTFTEREAGQRRSARTLVDVIKHIRSNPGLLGVEYRLRKFKEEDESEEE